MRITEELITSIKDCKSHLSINNDELGETIGVSGQTISKWFNGKVETIRVSNLNKLAKLLKSQHIPYFIPNSEPIQSKLSSKTLEKELTLKKISESLPYYIEKGESLSSFSSEHKKNFHPKELAQLITYLNIDHTKLGLEPFEMDTLDFKLAAQELSTQKIQLYCYETAKLIKEDYVVNNFSNKNRIALQFSQKYKIIDKEINSGDVLICSEHQLNNDKELAGKYILIHLRLDTPHFDFLKIHYDSKLRTLRYNSKKSYLSRIDYIQRNTPPEEWKTEQESYSLSRFENNFFNNDALYLIDKIISDFI
ncbi:hypothetical protein LNTAR_14952 [Lentisphaera araneosa HTCC2155]|uniref:HTH cro/C1-type domain-containing protein n=1 Tax=Lentisphaera araneosa HTCC2155 TaxID=313628 RepID=A6DHP2_9BACT|nr:helix-turn-helix domain-containing protein [Lentisphaera araneosa]EDM29125.1 hypothetical protein LNTAR_14952 [Lentisphaera araneosa HTCC2155]